MQFRSDFYSLINTVESDVLVSNSVTKFDSTIGINRFKNLLLFFILPEVITAAFAIYAKMNLKEINEIYTSLANKTK